MSIARQPVTRRAVIGSAAAAPLALAMPFVRIASAAPATIRYATGGGIGPNEMETVIYLDWMQKNVLKGYGKDYTVDMTFTRGTPEAGTLLAAGQADMATLSFAVFATAVLKSIVPEGISIVCDNYQDGYPGYAQNTFFVLADSPIKSTQDLKGKKVGINAFGSAVDLALRIKLKKDGIDPRKDLSIVEVAFPNQAAALREKRIDCGILILPFMATELRKGDLRGLFTGGDAFGPYAVIFQVVTDAFLKKNREAVKSYLADYVRGLQWFSDPANRKKAIEITADFTKSPADVLASYFMTKGDYYRDPHGCVAAKVIQTPIDAMASEGLIDKSVKVTDHLNLGLLPYPCSA
ncbi:MAG TPA: ABC transporter substrate-binding protein [Xanthobacteraceae bacterium]|jgi:NitT/TauT family transport system substrate-binding protein